jgi:hypothetical protein
MEAQQFSSTIYILDEDQYQSKHIVLCEETFKQVLERCVAS